MTETDEALQALASEFALFKCDRLFVVSPIADADGCYPAIATVERDVIIPGLGSFCPKGKYKYDGENHDCAAGIEDFIRHVTTRWVDRGMNAHVVAFVYFCDRQAHDAAADAADAAYAAYAAYAAAYAADAAYAAYAAAYTADAAYAAYAAAYAADAAYAAYAAAYTADAADAADAAAYAADAAAYAADAAYAAYAAAYAARAATWRAQLAFIKRIDPESEQP
jgi:hypothetical protein